MRYKLTLLLILLNTALFSYIFLANRARDARFDVGSESRLLLNPDYLQGIQSIHVSTPLSDVSWTLQRADFGWQVIHPLHWNADPYAVEKLLFTLANLSWESRFSVENLQNTGQTLASYNLESAPVQVDIKSATGDLTLFLGNQTDIGDRLYIRASGNEYVHVVDRELLRLLAGDFTQYMSSEIFDMSVEQVRGLQVLNRSDSNLRVRLLREQRNWRFVSPIEAPADPDRVDALVERWLNFSIARFLPTQDSAELNFQNSPIRLILEGLSGQEALSVIPNPNRNLDLDQAAYLAKRDAYGAVFEIPQHRIDPLLVAQEDLREKRVLRDWAADWNSLEVRTELDALTLQRLETGQWQVLRTNEEGDLVSLQADARAVKNLKSVIDGLEAVRFVSEAPTLTDLERFGLSNPQRIIRLRNSTGGSTELRIGGVVNDANLFYARVSHLPAVFLLRPHVLAEFPLSPQHYQERVIRQLREGDKITQLRLLDLQKSATLIEVDFAADAPSDELADALRRWMRRIEFERILPQPFSDPLQLDSERSIPWRYRINISYTVANGSEETFILLSERLGGGIQYVGDPTSGTVGMLPGDLIELLDPMLAEFPESPTMDSDPAQ